MSMRVSKCHKSLPRARAFPCRRWCAYCSDIVDFQPPAEEA